MRPARPALLAFACLSALALAATPTTAGVFGSKKKPEAAALPPPPPPPPPVAALPGPVLQAAGAYRIYMRRAGGVTAPHAGAEIESALELAEASEPVGMAKGEVAYVAVIALQEPTFVEGVRQFAADPGQRRLIAQRLAADASYAMSFTGAQAAAASASQALVVDAGRVHEAGKAVKQSAYDMQHETWSKGDIPNRPGRLARAKTLASTPMAATPEEMSALAAADAAASPGQPRLVAASSPAPTGAAVTSAVQHGLAIAALAALGETGDDNDARVQTLLNDSGSSFCHNMSKLNLYQCLAVAKPYYEDAFCLGQHVLLDAGQCVMKDAGYAVPTPVKAETLAAEAPAQSSAKPKGKRRNR